MGADPPKIGLKENILRLPKKKLRGPILPTHRVNPLSTRLRLPPKSHAPSSFPTPTKARTPETDRRRRRPPLLYERLRGPAHCPPPPSTGSGGPSPAGDERSPPAAAAMRGSPPSRRLLQRVRQLLVSPAGCIRIKLLLTCCISVSLVLFAARSSSCLPWPSLGPPPGYPSSPRQGSTILINTWKRNDLLKQSIAHYASCSCVDSIHIVWSEPNPPSIPLQRYLSKVAQSNSGGVRNIELKFDINKEDSLNNRFKVIKDLKTQAVFSIDDDVIFSCTSVDFAFRVWQSAPDTMVGFVPRMHWLDRSKGMKESYTYGGWWSVWWMGSYSMVLSKAAFFHKKYLGLYTNHMPAAIHDYIRKNRNCEDIAMSFLVANVTGAPPIWVKGKIFEIGSTGISSLGGHNERRTKCVNDFVDIYGYMPLVSTYVKAVDSRRLWLW